MSNISSLMVEVNEIVDPLIAMGATDETIKEQVEKIFKDHKHYAFISMAVTTKLSDRDFGNADLYV